LKKRAMRKTNKRKKTGDERNFLGEKLLEEIAQTSLCPKTGEGVKNVYDEALRKETRSLGPSMKNKGRE